MINYLAAMTTGGELWVAFEGGRICLSQLGTDEDAFVAECERRLGTKPVRAENTGLERSIAERLGADTTVPFDLDRSTPFQRQVLQEVASIPRGQVRTYGQVAAAVGRPRAARAVGEVMRTNPIPVLIPCHRVVRSGGQLGNYSPRPELKRHFLIEEGALSS